MSKRFSYDELNYCLSFIEGKTALPGVKNASFPESLLPSHKDFYDTWQRFMDLLSPILDYEIYDSFYDVIGDMAYFRYRKAGITTIKDFIVFSTTHTKRECNIMLSECDKSKYSRDAFISRLYELIISECYHVKNPHREEVIV